MRVSLVSTTGSDFPFIFGLALTPEQAQEIPEAKGDARIPPSGLRTGSGGVRSQARGRHAENPSFVAFARENGTVYYTCTVSAPIRSSPRTARS